MLSGPSRPVEVSDAFEHLCLDVFPDGQEGSQLLVYLTARFDESENHQVGWPHIYTVAGWIAETKQWKQLGSRWRLLLRLHGIDWFHMTDFIGGYKDFSDWKDEQQKDQRFREYCKLIRKFRLHGIGSGIHTKDYDVVITPELEKEGLANRYYGFNIVRVMEDIENWIDAQNYAEPVSVHYVFSQGAGREADRDIAWLFNKLNNDPELRERFRIGEQPYSMAYMKRDPRLQPADILACLTNRYSARFERTGKFTTEHWWEVMIEVLKGAGGTPRITETLYNDKETLSRWAKRVASIEDVVSPVAKDFGV